MLSQAELLLACSDDPAAVRRYAKSMAEDLRHLSDLVEGFLRLVRPLAQEDTSHHVSVYVHDLVLEAVRRSRSLARDREVRVVPTLADSGTEPEVLGDPALLAAMIENLVRNAVRFSPRKSQVEVRVQVQPPSILLHVRDHGEGIAAEHLESVFDWFFRAPGVTLASSGTGFGLAIAKRIAQHHGGTISLRSMPDRRVRVRDHAATLVRGDPAVVRRPVRIAGAAIGECEGHFTANSRRSQAQGLCPTSELPFRRRNAVRTNDSLRHEARNSSTGRSLP